MKYISYSLFEPKKLYDHRFWDEDRMDQKRYWFNIPALLLINHVLYPDYKSVFYMDEDTFNSDISKLMVDLLGDFSFQMRRVSEDYSGHEPALWRLKPIWSKDCDILMSRDIDSVPNIDEYRSFRLFEKSDHTVHTIRSHPNHYNFPCRMLMGLSAFKPKRISYDIKTYSFDDFKNRFSYVDRWDNDQMTMINCFTTNAEFTNDYFLDSPINDQYIDQDFPCDKVSKQDLKSVEISDHKKRLFDLIEEYGLSDWAGQPCDARKDFLVELYHIFCYKKSLEKIANSNLKDFYL